MDTTWKKKRKKDEKNEEMKASGSLNPLGELPISLKIEFCFGVLSTKGKDQTGDEKELSPHH